MAAVVKTWLFLGLLMQAAPADAAADFPNVVYILCDDLGYGDVHCLAPGTSKIPTPNADRLAREGMVFTDAHSGASVCTPTRYGVLTGRYCWRTRFQSGIASGFKPSLIAPDRVTVAGFLSRRGYATAAIGKWHLDYQYLDAATGEPLLRRQHRLPPVGARIPDGPVDRGFDYFHGFHHSQHMQAVVEHDRVVEHDTVINMLPRLQRKAVEYLQTRAAEDRPFFLYLALSSPHTPIVPSPEWQGKSGLGDYGDFVMQTDHVLGEVCIALHELGMASNTLVIFTSDNGCSKEAGIDALARRGHLVSAGMRGSKSDIWEGGHRVPFIVRWPGKARPGAVCGQLICLTDLFATMAEIVGEEIPAGACEDSVSILPALLGQTIESTRAGLVHHSISGHFAYRSGPWKLALARGSGGWSSPTERQASADSPRAQLYDLSNDIAEQKNLHEQETLVADELLGQLTHAVRSGRTTAGAPSANDSKDIVLWKNGDR